MKRLQRGRNSPLSVKSGKWVVGRSLLRQCLANTDFADRFIWTTLARDYSFGSSTLISGGHVDGASARWFCVAERC